MKILLSEKVERLQKIKEQWEIAELVYTTNEVEDKDMAIRKLNAAIRDIFTVIGV